MPLHRHGGVVKWRHRNGIWWTGPFTVRTELDPRTKIVLFELYDTTRFVAYFGSAQEARKHAHDMTVANDNNQQRRAAS